MVAGPRDPDDPGSSPRLRGTRGARAADAAGRRFIPAPAGNTGFLGDEYLGKSVHPRACGEHSIRSGRASQRAGSSPRLRGTPAASRAEDAAVRFIPAPAGNTARPTTTSRCGSVHPRACGEHSARSSPATGTNGSSPRLRGTRGRQSGRGYPTRFIPAPAGNTHRCGLPRTPFPVHPRACGEHDAQGRLVPERIGSSPRLRGTRAGLAGDRRPVRFIPAPAGNTARPSSPCAAPSVHPRACGEHSPARSASIRPSGSSPRLRGTRAELRHEAPVLRFIPAPAGNTVSGDTCTGSPAVHPRACGEHQVDPPAQAPRHRFIPAPAGNTATTGVGWRRVTVHPRACGEHRIRSATADCTCGSSPRLRGTQAQHRDGSEADAVHPRACGEHRRARRPDDLVGGSSPRLRGTLSHPPGRRLDDRFIPAPAGNTTAGTLAAPRASVHPRACGEHYQSSSGRRRVSGSSPRLRGTPYARARRRRPARFIPAPAGNTSGRGGAPPARSVHPRACGEHTGTRIADWAAAGSSPRLRGTLVQLVGDLPAHRFIPAPAGNTGNLRVPKLDFPVHPRACGEHLGGVQILSGLLGSSPRLRGTPVVYRRVMGVHRFIPAPAGNTWRRRGRRTPRSVHPRACGEHSGGRSERGERRMGSSPRLRGTRA